MPDREWIPTTEVREGDQLAHKLSDTPWTYTTVTGWSDRYLTACDVTHRTFTVTGAPWWVRADNFELVADLAGQTLIRRREPGAVPPAIHNEGRPVTPEWEQGYAAGMQDGADSVLCYRPYRNPDSDWQRGYNDAYRTLHPA